MQGTSIIASARPDLSQVSWENLSKKRILFGHQSVGFNIVDGIEDVLKENSQIKINIIENSRPWEVKTPSLIHFMVGENQNRKSKMDAFSALIQREDKKTLDIAFFKLCFVDIQATTNVSMVFDQYKTIMGNLMRDFPETTFIVVTVPLTSEPTGTEQLTRGLKNWIKTAIGKSIERSFENVNRNNFNALLKKEYEGKVPIFDLATIESTGLDGKRQMFSVEGKNYYSMLPAYTDDGGHLNKLGRKVVAEQLLVFLAKLSK
jgi:hypothetical protein